MSTDDEEIASVAVKAGAQIPFLRSAINSDDFSGTAEVMIEVLNEYEIRGKVFTEGCCIYPTAPFVSAEKLKAGFALMNESAFDVVFPVCAFSYTIWRSLKKDANGKVEMNWPENQKLRSQDLPPTFHDAGQFYWFRSKRLKESRTLFGDNSGAIEIDEMEGQDIDVESDWKIAELKYRMLYEG